MSDIFDLLSSLNVRDQILHSCKREGDCRSLNVVMINYFL